MEKRRADAPWREPLARPGPVVIFDIDGVIADMSEHEYLIDTERAADRDWKNFHAHFTQAKPIPSGMKTLKKIYKNLGIDVAYSTTRPEQFARRTLWWMHHNHVPMGPMQLRQFIKDGPRPEVEVKLRHWWTWQKKFSDENPVLAWIDDDPQVRNILRNHGCPVWNPRELHRAALAEGSLKTALKKGPMDWDELKDNAESSYKDWKIAQDAWEEKRFEWWRHYREKMRATQHRR